MRNKNVSITALSLFIICALLLTANLLLGGLLLSRSKIQMKTLINERMLDIANTSADMLDGDALESFTEESSDTPAYQACFDTLKVFQDNIDLEYIYAVRDMKDGTFIFLVDPAEEDAGEYGECIVVTPALQKAAAGTPAVDDEPYSDGWGKFYSAYSPVFDSRGQVGGIVCVDFSAVWYDEQITRYTTFVVLFSLLSLLVGAAVVFVLTRQLRGSLRTVKYELGELKQDVDELMREIGAKDDGLDRPSPDSADAQGGKTAKNEIGELSRSIRSMRDMLRAHIGHQHAQANGMITAMASDYRSVYYIDLDADEGVCYRAHSKIDNGLREGERFKFSEVFSDYAQRYVVEGDRAEFLSMITPESIRRELEKESIVAHRYMVMRDGHESYEMFRMAGVRHPEDRDDHIVHAVGVGFTDVDKETRDTLRQQQALSDALTVAEEASKAKTAFLSSMSHEIRTPMNAIIGLDSIALSDPGVPAKTRDYLEKIGASARHLLGLINDILDMSRIESGRLTLRNEEFSFAKLLEQINTMVDSQCGDKGLSYECHIGDDLGAYYIGDDMKLKQVIINILGNAVKFTPRGGNVTLRVERAAHYEGKTTLRFTMSDTGIGMDKAFLPRIFDVFSQEDATTTNKYGSTGLGMAITKSIVEMMNGGIEVESEKGKGTTFTVTVTLLDASRETSGEERAVDLRGLSVLVVDDDPIAREHTQLVLGKLGVSTEAAASGAEALEMIKLRHARRSPYGVIFMDWKMPEMDGLETTRQIRSLLGGESAVVILTAYQWDDISEDAADAGVSSFLAKPLVAANAQEELERVLRAEQETKRGEKAELAGRRVLLAEDMPINAEIMTEVLGMREIAVEHAENGKIAVELFASGPPGRYDAILMDMRMPEMDGLEAAAAIRGMDRPDAKTIPIIALTANAFDEDVQRSLQAGLNAHLSKPVEPDELFSTLEDLL